MKTELFLAFRYLFRGRAYHVSFIGIISCIGIMLGVAALIVVISVMNGFDEELMETLMRFHPHITVESLYQDIPSDIITKIKNTKGIRSASVVVETQIFAKLNNYVVPVGVKGIDLNDSFERKLFAEYIVEEREGEGFFIGEGLRNRSLFAETIQYYPLEKKLKLKEDAIKGVFKVGHYDIDNNFLVCSLEKARSLSKNYRISLGVRIEDPFEAEEIKARIKMYGDGLVVSTWMEKNRALFSALKLEKLTMFVILSLIILVASFNIFATLTVKVVEKTKDIGILRALGFSPRKVLSVFSIQGILLGIIGVLFGVGVGLLLCILIRDYHLIRLDPQIYYIEYLPVSLNYADIGVVAVVGVALSFVSSLFPAIRASRLIPSDALRYE